MASPTPEPIRIKGVDTGLTGLIGVYDALDRGYFSQQGLDIELVTSNDTAVPAQMAATSQVAFENLSPDPVLSTPWIAASS